MSLSLKLALSPLLIAQAIRTRRQTTRLPEAEGPRAGMAGNGRAMGTSAMSLLILGDSSAAEVGVAMQHEALAGHLPVALSRVASRRVRWTLIARSGINSLQVQALWRSHGAPPAEIAVVVTGVNDVVDQIAPRRALQAREALTCALQAEGGVHQVVFTPVPPMQAFSALPQPLRWVAGRDATAHDRALAWWVAGRTGCSRPEIELPLDPALLARDGFHPGPRVYRAWGEALAAHIARLAT